MSTRTRAATNTETPTAIDARRALGHPVFWVALGLLALNDHVLKGAGILPGLVTGKLSDLTGLVMAPALSAAIVGARSRWAIVAAFVPVTALFVAIKVSEPAARAFEAAMSAVGVQARIWVDPTDLLALVGLAGAWWLATRPAERSARPRRVAWLHRAAIGLGAAASVATSAPPGRATQAFEASVFVYNDTGATVTVRLRPATAALDCNAIESDPGAALGREAFGDGATYELEDGELLNVQERTDASACWAALVRMDGLDDTVVLGANVPRQQIPVPFADVAPQVGLLRLRPASGGRFELANEHAGPGQVVVDDYEDAPELMDCGTETGTTFDWAFDDLAQRSVELTEITETPDGCLELGFAPTSDTPNRGFLCVPRASFPFVVGDTLEVGHDAWELRLTGGRHGRTELIVYHGYQDRTGALAASFGLEPAACMGEREPACGAFVRPWVAVRRAPNLGGRERRIVGRAAETLASPSACDRPTGLVIDAIITRSE